MHKQMFADSTINNIFTVDKSVIRVIPNGNSVLVMEQYLSNPYAPKIPLHLAIQTVKTTDVWNIDFLCCNLIPKNKNIGKLNMAFE